MTEKLEFYKCNICGNIVQVVFEGVGELTCCGEKMTKLEPQTEENSELGEKHVPVIETDVNGRFVRLTKHPMLEEHYIQLIQAVSKDKSVVHFKYLRPEESAEFDITGYGELSCTLELCNIHGLWKSEEKENK